jgi:hypothetical protein
MLEHQTKQNFDKQDSSIDPQVELHLLQDILEAKCNKWFSLTTSGTLNIKDLIEKGCDVKYIFTQSELLGISDPLPAIIANSSSLQPYCLYLEKFPGDIDSADIQLWIEALCKKLKGYIENNIGIYIPPQLNEMLSEDTSFLSCLLENLITAYPNCNYYLFAGRYSMNEILTQALQVKTSLEKKDIIATVYH